MPRQRRKEGADECPSIEHLIRLALEIAELIGKWKPKLAKAWIGRRLTCEVH